MSTNQYGVQEQGNINDFLPAGTGINDFLDKMKETVDWTDKRLARITRLRLLTDAGFPAYDVSYVWGELKDGSPVFVTVPFDQLARGRRAPSIMRQIVAHGIRDGVYVKGLLNEGDISILF